MNQLNELEQLKKKVVFIKRIYKGMWYFLLGFFFLNFLTSFRLFPFDGSRTSIIIGTLFFFLPMCVVGIALYYISERYDKEYQQKVKMYYVVSCLNELFDEVEYDFSKGFDREFIDGTELVKTGLIYSSNDFIAAKYKGIPFQMSDLLITDDTEGNGNKNTSTLFFGQWFVFEFNKNFTGYLQLRDREEHTYRNGKPYSIFSKRENCEQIKFENDEFNQVFTSYASNAQEAFYLITPHFMEKILSLKAKLEGELLIGFIDNQLHIALNSGKDLFEQNIWKDIADEYFEDVLSDLSIVTSIIDELDLAKLEKSSKMVE